ncbi:MAG: F0F1 ATP synthase subunit A [Rhodospirillales bacterium]|nr:F0F1 ATP synthase subunit A [Rhodospirillales bacterium]MCB9964916.1 F0F1 ATP synthase subunit A [Rhodospirillales bacterium]MCB9973710.1 F0F1 ATP synthase subunit A [Rhodospirillales bacterium]
MADPLHQFVIQPWIPFEIGSLNLSYTNSAFWMTVGVVGSLLLFSAASGKQSMVPGRLQMFGELFYGFVASMIRTNLGPKGQEFFGFVFTVFVLVLAGNLLGLLPYAFTYTSHLAVTGTLALMIFCIVIGLGLARHGLKFFSLFCPAGTPWWITPLIIPIEIISFISRPVTLSLRLFINMMVGHLMLKVIAGFSVMMIGAGLGGFLGALFPMAFNVIMIGFETFIALIQAYVFALLTCIYLKDTIELHH